MTPKYSPGDRIQFEPDMGASGWHEEARHWKGTISNVRVTNNGAACAWNIFYDVDWDLNVMGLLGSYTERNLSTTPQMERENKLRKLGI